MYGYGVLKPFKEGVGGRGRIMEGMNQTGYIVQIYGNVTIKHPVQILCTNKKF
jgi:hypothetical protein